VIFTAGELRYAYYYSRPPLSPTLVMLGWTLALGLPLLLAAVFRRDRAMSNVAGGAWLLAVSQFNYRDNDSELAVYALCGVAAIGLIAWGLREAQKNYINVGVVGFALTVLFFYFSNVMDKLGRSFALITGGILFLVGGYFLEKVRRKLLRQLATQGGAA
jgi:uncharacterized membrane protein